MIWLRDEILLQLIVQKKYGKYFGKYVTNPGNLIKFKLETNLNEHLPGFILLDY